MLPVVPLAVAALVQSPDWLAVCSTQIHPALEVVFAQDAAQSQPAAPPLFRTFTGDVPLPTELLNELEQMRLFAEKHRLHPEGGHTTGFDADGRETCSDPAFAQLREALVKKLDRQAGWLGRIVRESPSLKARMAAYYGGFFVESVQDSFYLLSYAPAEPVPEIRQECLRLIGPFVERWTAAPPPLTEQQQLGPLGPSAPAGGYLPDLRPFINLLRSTSARDCALTLDVLERCLRLQRRAVLPLVESLATEFRAALRSGNEDLVAACRRFLATLAEDRGAGEGDAARLEQRFGAELKRLFPAIRTVSEGLVELYPGLELEQAITVGRAALERGTLGAQGEIPATHNRRQVVRGLVLSLLPPELKGLGFKPGDCITAVDGMPVLTCRSLLDLLEAGARARRKTFLVEYFADEQSRAREFRLQS